MRMEAVFVVWVFFFVGKSSWAVLTSCLLVSADGLSMVVTAHGQVVVHKLANSKRHTGAWAGSLGLAC